MSFLQMNITAGMLVIAIVLLRSVALNRLPKLVFLTLWGVVLLRLFVPFAIPLQFGLYSAAAESISTILPIDTTPPIRGNEFSAGDMARWAESVPATQNQANETMQVQATRIPFLVILWLAVMLAMLTFFAVIYIKNRRKLRFAMLIQDNPFVHEWLTEHKLLRPLAVMQSDAITTPIAVGLFKPRIILPKCMDRNDTQLLRHVLMHEYCHIRRFDVVWKSLFILALCIHWFNPLVWIMFVLANRDLELSCDETVMHHFGIETKAAYAHSLIHMAEEQNKFVPLLYNGFSKYAVAERIESILKGKKTTLVSTVVATVIISALALGALAMPSADSAESAAHPALNLPRVLSLAHESEAEELPMVPRNDWAEDTKYAGDSNTEDGSYNNGSGNAVLGSRPPNGGQSVITVPGGSIQMPATPEPPAEPEMPTEPDNGGSDGNGDSDLDDEPPVEEVVWTAEELLWLENLERWNQSMVEQMAWRPFGNELFWASLPSGHLMAIIAVPGSANWMGSSDIDGTMLRIAVPCAIERIPVVRVVHRVGCINTSFWCDCDPPLYWGHCH